MTTTERIPEQAVPYVIGGIAFVITVLAIWFLIVVLALRGAP